MNYILEEFDMDIITAVRKVRGKEPTKNYADLVDAERSILEAVKNGWKVVPPRSWHENYIWDETVGRNLELLCQMDGLEYAYDRDGLFRVKCTDEKYQEICRKVNITPIYGAAPTPSQLYSQDLHAV